MYNWGSESRPHGAEQRQHVCEPGQQHVHCRPEHPDSHHGQVVKEPKAISRHLGYPAWTGQVYLYESGNKIDSNKNLVLDPIPVTNANVPVGSLRTYAISTIVSSSSTTIRRCTTQSARRRLSAGSRQCGRLAPRDAVDQRLIADVTTQDRHIITSQTQVGGYPILTTTTRPRRLGDATATACPMRGKSPMASIPTMRQMARHCLQRIHQPGELPQHASRAR